MFTNSLPNIIYIIDYQLFYFDWQSKGDEFESRMLHTTKLPVNNILSFKPN